MTEIQKTLATSSTVFIFTVDNARTELLQRARAELKGRARFFNGKKRVMAKALGSSAESEIRAGISGLSSRLKGDTGLLVVREEVPASFCGTLEDDQGFITEADLREYLESLAQPEYARAGSVATETVTVDAGAVVTREGVPVPSSLDGQLRQAGLPVSLLRGVVTLNAPHVICTEGDTLTPDQARLLKLLDYPTVTFRIRLLSRYRDGEIVDFEETADESECDDESDDEMEK